MQADFIKSNRKFIHFLNEADDLIFVALCLLKEALICPTKMEMHDSELRNGMRCDIKFSCRFGKTVKLINS